MNICLKNAVLEPIFFTNKARKRLILNPDFQPLKHLKKKDIAMPGNLMAGLS